MPISLSKDHRKLLEKTTAAARTLAESACRAALENLGVHEKDYRTHMSVDQRVLRNRLRARGRTVGDARDKRTGIQEIHHLGELAAYEHWHRLLFTRFLTENNLLITDEANGSVPVTLEECEELAPDLGARDGLDLACQFASLTLPGVFRRDDPVLDLPIALNDQVELRKLLTTLPSECFLADDSLGWTYQYWQAQRKNEVNDSGKKIGADELAAVTQLFTEDYMVEFLLHNTLGAWWAGKMGPISAATEEDARGLAALGAKDGAPAISWRYLRFRQDETTKCWQPAAGNFETWPRDASLIRLLDPCMGSGHFLVFALPLLVRLRMEEEKLDAKDAVVATIQDNVHGLELDERCTQIAVFNVALAAWKLGGYQALPALHIACSGLAPNTTEAEWVALAGDNEHFQRGMARLYALFREAPILGSLISPRAQAGDLIEAEFNELAPLLTAALAPAKNQKDRLESDEVELAVIAQGLAKAAELLAGQFVLVATNVPYLTRQGQCDILRDHCERAFPTSKADLATCFVERIAEFLAIHGTMSVVAPTNWLYQPAYKRFRRSMLEKKNWHAVVRLGPGAFDGISGEVVNVTLVVIGNAEPKQKLDAFSIDATDGASAFGKAEILVSASPRAFDQVEQLANPDARIVLGDLERRPLLAAMARSLTGLRTADNPQFMFGFWEVPRWGDLWVSIQSTVADTTLYGGRSHILRWDSGGGTLASFAQLGLASIQGRDAWGKRGVTVSLMGDLPVTLYSGDKYDMNCGALWPLRESDLPAVWAYCSSKEFSTEVRKIDQQLKLTTATLLKIPFDLAFWQQAAAVNYPNGLPKPHSADPTQWLFDGHPKGSEQPLHVAVARLLGYRWPRRTGSFFQDCPPLGPDDLDRLTDEDGIVCLPPLNREQPAAARLRQLLTTALGSFDERDLIAAAGLKGSKSRNLEDWLRDEFFEQHAKMFQDRPFIWHLWDGRADGFHALVNYHKLDYATLQKLAYSHLGDWIRQQDEDAKADKPGAAARLGPARALQAKLAAILEGDAPLDIFVRWKPLREQALGWHPDLNDGVRQNIRPFILAGDVGKRGAGIFRTVPLAIKDKDRGTDPTRPKKDYPWLWCDKEPGTDPAGGKEFVGNRWNSVHLTLARKQQAKA